MHKLGLTTHNPSAYRPSAYAMSAPLPENAAGTGTHSKADKLRPDLYKLSATVKTRTSEEDLETGNQAKSPNWFPNAPQNSKKSTRVDNSDNDSEQSLRIKSSRSSTEDDFQGIMVSKSFYITDEERGSIISAPYR